MWYQGLVNDLITSDIRGPVMMLPHPLAGADALLWPVGLCRQHLRHRGCQACRHTGYKGRVAFHELVLITEEVRTLISEGRSVQDISRAAAKVGYKPLRYDGLKKVLLGLTTIEEIEQNTSFEWAT